MFSVFITNTLDTLPLSSGKRPLTNNSNGTAIHTTGINTVKSKTTDLQELILDGRILRGLG